MSQQTFSNKVVVVTGASSGIGRALAIQLATAGAVVVAVARRDPELKQLLDECRQLSPRSCYIAGDLSGQVFAEGVIDQVVERFGRLDVLINNAAVPLHRDIYSVSAEQAGQVMKTNFMACLWMSLKSIPVMLAQGGGSIVNVSSFATIVTPTYETIYAASKSAMNGFSRGLWADLQGSGIHVMLVHPGPIDTGIWDKFDHPSGYSGRLYPPAVVAREILQALSKKRFEIVTPKYSMKLMLARLLSVIAPGLVRAGVRRMDPVKPELLARAKKGARA